MYKYLKLFEIGLYWDGDKSLEIFSANHLIRKVKLSQDSLSAAQKMMKRVEEEMHKDARGML